MSSLSSEALRARLDHPVIDADGHLLELLPVFEDWFYEFAKDLAGGDAAAELARRDGLFYDQRVQGRFEGLSVEERRRNGVNRPPFWSLPVDARDRATGYLPRLMAERLDEFGIDFGVIFPSRALPMVSITEPELRQVAIRALNHYHAELYSEFADRLKCGQYQAPMVTAGLAPAVTPSGAGLPTPPSYPPQHSSTAS